MCKFAIWQQIGVEKIKNKHSSILLKSIDITFIENGPVVSKSIEDKETDKHSFIFICIHIIYRYR